MGKYAKGIAAVLTAGLIAAQNVFPLTAQQHAWVTVILALLGSVAVYQVPNTPMPAVAPDVSGLHRWPADGPGGGS